MTQLRKKNSVFIAIISTFSFAVVALLLALCAASPAYAGDMFRMYNPNSGEHFYTSDLNERDSLYRIGWNYEGIGWVAPDEGDEVYRMYNPNSGDHHYTLDSVERDVLKRIGWNYEGVGWFSGGVIPLYRQFNPYATIGTHNYTTSKNENDSLASIGWRAEGIAWYGKGVGREESVPDYLTRDEPVTQAPADESVSSSGSGHPATVFVTRSGSKYHRSTCPTIQNSRNLSEISYESAVASSRDACKVCKP